MGILFLSLAGGALIGWRKWLPMRVLSLSGRGMTAGVVLLLIVMGVRIGSDKGTLAKLGAYGWQAFWFALAAVGASIGVVALLEYLFVKDSALPENDELKIEGSAHPYRMMVIILASFAFGILIGVSIFPLAWRSYLPALTDFALGFTLFAVGLDLGLNSKVWQRIWHLGWKVFLAPLGVVIGSVGAGMLIGILFGWDWHEGGAVGAGFGWYSLSGAMISDLHSVALGTIAFLSNIMRELMSILLVPFLARRVGPLILVAPGGATTMDSTLSLIAASGPPGIALIAFVNGVILSTLVPFLVPLLLGK